MEIFAFSFMRRAFLVGFLLAVIVPCIGVIVVLRRQSMIGDALSHASLAGVAAGLIAGINPVVGAMAACLLAALTIEGLRRRMAHYQELAIALILSAGVGLAGVLSGFVPNASGFNSFLFGSIVAIDDFEMWLVVGVSAFVLLSFLLLYKELCYLAFDEAGARLSGVPVDFVRVFFTLLTAVTVAVAARTVGALMVSSLMIIPMACAMQVAKSYRQTVGWAVVFGVCFTLGGLFLSCYLGLKPGGTIVLTGIAGLLLLMGARAVIGRRGR